MDLPSQEGAFNARKATLSLDLKSSDGLPLSLSSPAKSLLGSPLAVSNNMEITAAQKQYAQGFFDALRSVQSLHNFEFDNKKAALLSPGYLVPAVLGTTELASPFASTPTSNKELQAILQAMVGTPLGSAPSVSSVTGFPNAFSTMLPGPSTTATSMPSIPSTSVSTSSSDSGLGATTTHGPLKIDIKQEVTISDDSPDSTSEQSRSSSVALSGLPSSSSHGSSKYGMSLDEQERRKLERKRARNRAAASKCRQKKMDRINELETQVQQEKAKSQILDTQLMSLRTTLAQLEHLVQRHRSNGCPSAQC